MIGAREARRRRTAGLVVLGLVLVFTFGAFILLPLLTGLVPASPLAILRDPALRGIAGFTFWQAVLSTVLSVAGGVPLALALHRMRFRGREMILRLFFLPQALPVLVGALGLLAVFGRNGVVADGFALLGFSRPSIYGLPGILIAHVFFNMPLVARLVLGSLSGIPSESWKLAGQLSLTPWATFRIVEAPAIGRALPAAASLVFMLCVTSFTLVLVLGGGPAATTLEVAIYQSLRYDFDPGRAVTLSLLQILLVAAILVPTFRWTSSRDAGFGLGATAVRFDRPSPARTVIDVAVILIGLTFVAAPFVAILIEGLRADLWKLATDPAFHRATLTSLWIAAAATILALAAALALSFGAHASRAGDGDTAGRRSRILYGLAGSLVLVVPPVVVGAGWFLALRGFGDVARFAPFIVVLANAVIILPFATRILSPEIAAAGLRHDRLALGLGLEGLARLRHVELPSLKRPLALAGALGLAISIGDLGTVALFGNQDLVTLPYLLLQRMGSYRSTDAQGLALFLGVLCLVLIVLAERGFERGGARR